MLHIDLSPNLETRLKAQARAHGVAAEGYAKALIESAILSAPKKPHPAVSKRDMDAFFKGMTANSDRIPQLPDHAFTRESFYQDHD